MAQAYPTRPVRFIVPAPPGGSTDPAARFIAESMSRSFSQRVYVENRSGANGIIGIEAAARSAPDGHTVLVNGTAVSSCRLAEDDVVAFGLVCYEVKGGNLRLLLRSEGVLPVDPIPDADEGVLARLRGLLTGRS